MKYLNKFYTYLTESNSIDRKELIDLTYNLTDNYGAKLKEEKLIINSEFRKVFTIQIVLTDLNTANIDTSYNKEDIFMDDVYWEVLQEILIIKERAKEYNINIGVEMRPKFFKLYLISDLIDDILKNYYILLKKKIDDIPVTGGTSYDNMDASEITLGSDFIRITTDSEYYKQKQFNNFIKGIVDLDKVNVDKYVVDQEVINDIRLK